MGANTGLSGYELSLFFTIFVFLQFWNMFNARAFETGRSAFHFKGCGGLVFDGGSDASAIAAKVSMIRFTQSICVTVRG